jgi:hypothetical protein
MFRSAPSVMRVEGNGLLTLEDLDLLYYVCI